MLTMAPRCLFAVFRNKRVHVFVFGLFALVGVEVIAYSQSKPLDEPGFVVRKADVSLEKNVYIVNAQIDGRLSQQVVEALHKGVALYISLDLEVWRRRDYWMDARVVNLEQRFQLRYHALTDQYLLINLNSGVRNSYPSLLSALDVMGTVVNLPLLDKDLLTVEGEHEVRIRSRLDINSLPGPLRLMAYVSPGWQLKSEWYSWKLDL